MERLTRMCNGMLALAFVFGLSACAGDTAQEPYEEPEQQMERPPEMGKPAPPGSLESQ